MAKSGGTRRGRRLTGVSIMDAAELPNLHCRISSQLRSSIREMAKHLDRAASTVGREVTRHGGRPAYRAHEADDQAWESALRTQKVPSGPAPEVARGGYE